jgi:hypothetical protein
MTDSHCVDSISIGDGFLSQECTRLKNYPEYHPDLHRGCCRQDTTYGYICRGDGTLCKHALGHPQMRVDMIGVTGTIEGHSSTPIFEDVTSIPAANTKKAFQLFSLLPLELRLLIWQFALPGPRIVFLQPRRLQWFRCTRVFSDRDIRKTLTSPVSFEGDFLPYSPEVDWENVKYGGNCYNRYGFTSYSSIAMLYVCRESYSVASQVYERAFGTTTAFAETWFNFNLDTLYLDCASSYILVPHDIKDLDRVQHLALHCLASFRPIRPPEGFTRRRDIESRGRIANRLFERMPSLKTYTSIAKRHGNSCNDLVFMDVKDIAGCLELYSQPYDPATETSFMNMQEDYIQEGQATLLVDPNDVKERRAKRQASGFQRRFGTSFYTMPSIHQKMVTTSRLKSRLERAEKDYLERKSKFYEDNWIGNNGALRSEKAL